MKFLPELELKKEVPGLGLVCLRSLKNQDLEDLIKISQDPRIWEHAHMDLHIPSQFEEKWFKKALKKFSLGTRWPLVILVNGKMAGSSSYYEIDDENKALCMGLDFGQITSAA